MKKSLSVLCMCLLLVCGLSIPTLAAEEESSMFPTTTVEESVSGSIFNFDLNFNGAVPPIEYVSTEILPLPSGPRDGFAGVVSALFGTYEPKTYVVDTIIDGVLVDSDTQYVPGLAGLDYEWIACVVLFSIVLFCFLRMVGGILK